MKPSNTNIDFDDLFSYFLNESDTIRANSRLEEICEAASPIIDEIIRFKLRSDRSWGTTNQREDAADVRGDITLRLVRRLNEIKSTGVGEGPRNLRGYVATVAYNACDEYLRRKYPRRHSLKNKLRYVLSHQRGLSIWEQDSRKWVCGFSAWRNEKTAATLESIREEVLSFLGEALTQDRRNNAADLLAAIFDRLGSPVYFDEVAKLAAEFWNVRDLPVEIAGDQDEILDPRPSIDAALDHRAAMERLWVEIGQLPIRQRVALLLHSRDARGTSVVVHLPRTGIASIREIAATLGVAAEQLAALWKELPLDDTAIADMLGVTRQQVINLRKSARERLTRRMAAFKTGGQTGDA